MNSQNQPLDSLDNDRTGVNETSIGRCDRVYITNDTGQKFYLAEKYGELVRLSEGSVNAQKSFHELVKKFTNLIDRSSPDDYLLLAGNNLLCVLAFNIWKTKHGKVKLLHWNPAYYHNSKPLLKYDCYTI